MGQEVQIENADGQKGLYGVACVHCEKKVFKFTENYLNDCGEVTLSCPNCGGITKVTGNGEVSAG